MKGLKVLKGDPFVDKPKLPPGRKNSNARMQDAEKHFAKRIIAGGAVSINCRGSTAKRRKFFRHLRRMKKRGKPVVQEPKKSIFQRSFEWLFRRSA